MKMVGTRNARVTTYSDLNRQQRQRSTSQTNLTDQTDRRQTYGGLRRSVSNSNLRTPRRTLANRSPGNRTPSTATGLVSNSEQNRRQAAENAAKVKELIQSSRTFFNRLNLVGGELRAMTLNQFHDIISFFMVKIAGKNLISKIHVNNHENVIVTFLEALKFPYTINKNCLRTPNAHNCFPDAIAILAFLSDLVRDVKKYAVPTDMPLIHCDQLMKDDFTKVFSAEVRRNYLLDKKLDEKGKVTLDEEGERIVLNGMIAIKMKNDNLTIEQLHELEEKLRKSSEELQRKLVQTDCDKYFETIVEQYAGKEKEYQKLKETLAEKRTYLKMITLTHEEKAKELAAKQAMVQEMAHRIKHQKYTVIDIKQVLAKETTIKNSIGMIQTETDAIKVDAANVQVKLARIQKLKLDSIKRFNDLTFQITRKLMQCHSYVNLNVNDFTIDPTASNEAILNICSRLHQLNEHLMMVKEERTKQIQRNQAKVTELKVQSNRLTEKYATKMTEHDEAEQKLHTINQMYLDCEMNKSSNRAKLEREIEDKIVIKAKLDEEIAALQKLAQELAAKNVQLFEDGERKALEIIRAKEEVCRQLDTMIDAIDECTQQH